MTDRAYLMWLVCGLALCCVTWFWFGYMIGSN